MMKGAAGVVSYRIMIDDATPWGHEIPKLLDTEEQHAPGEAQH
jgi:hypothetical protein